MRGKYKMKRVNSAMNAVAKAQEELGVAKRSRAKDREARISQATSAVYDAVCRLNMVKGVD